jgi:NadR type nicotinamide-nucleotide adenylyltransferase
MSRSFARGLVVGKFCPLHRGHELTIRTMLDACREGFVLSYTNPEFAGCEPERRRRWLAELFPSATCLVLAAHEAPPNDADEVTHRRFVAQICRERWHTTVDAVFTSESYGDGFARELAREFALPVSHVCVDAARRSHPVSGTELRADVHARREQLSPVVYADFVQRVALLGGESSGKSTLAAALAEHFGTRHVAEYGRDLWDERAGRLEYADMLHIARTQVAREDAAARSSNRYLFCDTSPLTTLFYSRHLFGRAEPELEALAEREYALHVLCAPDFPFVQDGTRQDAAFRSRQHAWYRAELERRSWPWIEVTGAVGTRAHQVEARLRGRGGVGE